MIKFYLPKSKTKYSVNCVKDSFMIGSLGIYKRLLLNKVNVNKCDYYDDEVISFINSKPDVENINTRKHLCYDIIIYSIKCIKCFKDDSGEYLYSLDIPLNNPFGSKHTVELILRLIEYGNADKIRPYGIFNKTLLELRDLHQRKLNLL